MSALKKASRTKSLSLSQDDFIFPRAPRMRKSMVPQKPEDTLKLMKYIDDNIIGKGVLFLGPFGRRKGKSRKTKFSKILVVFLANMRQNLISSRACGFLVIASWSTIKRRECNFNN